jgi:hypothetical protein
LQVPKHVRVVHIPLLGVFCKNIVLLHIARQVQQKQCGKTLGYHPSHC